MPLIFKGNNMTTFNWTIQQMDRLTADGFVVTVHYRVLAIDGDDHDCVASTYGTISYTQEQGETYIPYASLTQAIVVGWVQESLGKDVVEASLAANIALQKAPVTASGTPWGQA
jgi:hypothetical protein